MDSKELASIKKPNEVEYITKEEYEQRVRTIARCKRDIVWWAENFFRIVSLSSGLQLIKLYDKQKDLLNFLLGNDRAIVLASRQTGRFLPHLVF